MPAMFGFKFMGTSRSKFSHSVAVVAPSGQQQPPQILAPVIENELTCKESELSGEIEDEKPAASKETRCSWRADDTSSAMAEEGESTNPELAQHKNPIPSAESISHQTTKSLSSIHDMTELGEGSSFVHWHKSALSTDTTTGRSNEVKSHKSEISEASSSIHGTIKDHPRRRTKSIPSEISAGRNSSIVTRKTFKSVKAYRNDETFTNHESLPCLAQAYAQFAKTYPEYLHTVAVDKIRQEEYPHLEESGHICLDYCGYGLFSESQQRWQKSSSSFGLAYISANLPTHALYGNADAGTAEFDIKCRVCSYLNIQESEYCIVFTASRGSAFKLLAESYPFHLKKRLLTLYDYESDAVNWMEETARKKGANVISARFRWPSLRLWATDLQKKITEKKKKKEPGKGLFIFPMQSRVTGSKYSYQWMAKAHDNNWDVLLDASALGPKAMGSLGLSVFQPDFIVSSFYKVYGSDPTGFGCLLIKHSAIQGLHNSSAARGVGMVKLVPLPALSDTSSAGGLGGEHINMEKQVHENENHNEGESLDRPFSRPASQGEFISIPAFSGPLARMGANLAAQSAASSGVEGMVAPMDEEESSSGKLHQFRPAHKTSNSELEREQSNISSLDRINEDYVSEDLETFQFDEIEESDSESIHDHQRVMNLLREQITDSGNAAEDGRVPMGCQSQQEECEASSSRYSEALSQQKRRQNRSASAYYIGSQGDQSFVYSEDASLAFPDEGDEGSISEVACDPPVVRRKEPEIVCKGLDHADTLGLSKSNTRLRCLINWLIASMLKLHHPGSQDSHHLVQIYGPKISYDRGASVAFNLFDWKGNILQPALVQRLADRSNISLGTTTLHHIRFPENHLDWPGFTEPRNSSVGIPTVEGQLEGGGRSPSIEVSTVALGFITNFADVYRFWVFLAKFLDADFVSKEEWRYRSLNQETVVLGMQEAAKSPLH